MFAAWSGAGLYPDPLSVPQPLVVTLDSGASEPAAYTDLPAPSMSDTPPPPEPSPPPAPPTPAPAAPQAAISAPQAVAETLTPLDAATAVAPEPATPPPAERQQTQTPPVDPADAVQPGPPNATLARSIPESSPVAPQETVTATERATPSSSQSSARARERYLARLLAHIEANKYYPGSARRRRLEGAVSVAFVLREDGRIENLAVDNGPAVLRDAARRTLRRASPLPRPPRGVVCPLPVRYVMRYALR